MDTYFRPEFILSQIVGSKIALLPEFIILITCIMFVFKDNIIKFIKDMYNYKKCSVALTSKIYMGGTVVPDKFYQEVMSYFIKHKYVNKLQASKYDMDSYGLDIITNVVEKFNIDNLSFSCYVIVDSSAKGDNIVKQHSVILISSNNMDDITKFIENCVKEYENRSLNRLYTTSYDSIIGSLQILEDKQNKKINYQTFDNLLYCKYANYIKKELDTLANSDNYKDGKRQKLSFLAVGPPGTGKTFIAQAMALYSRKHLIRVQLCKLKKYEDITNLFDQTIYIGRTAIKSNQAIIFFDEIDKFINAGNDTNTVINKNQDKLQDKLQDKAQDKEKGKGGWLDPIEVLNLIMESMDTVGIYDGQIYIAAANSIEGLHPALLRPGRFKVLKFNLLTLEDLIDYGKKIAYRKFDLPKEYDNKFSHAEVFSKQFESLEEYLEHLKSVYEASLTKE